MLERLHGSRKGMQDQRKRWDEAFAERDFFGPGASPFGQWALSRMRGLTPGTVLDLGTGQGRDALAFADHGLEVTALDYSAPGLRQLADEAERQGMSSMITTLQHDLNEPMPFPDESFGAVYAHMLLCMEFDAVQVSGVLAEVRRVLAPDGLFLFSVRTVQDAQCGMGRHIRETLYEIGGFAIRFFSREMVRACAGGGMAVEAMDHFQEGSAALDIFAACLRRTGAAWDPRAEVRLQEAFSEAHCDSGMLEGKGAG
ncbi:class I SAM-dependent methyltransferase [Oceanidesulfovibrio indonesiensis]|nr:class I SAM-dependent methyltransferase [Oceanidesulfovibrio indonesiensis]